MNIPDKHKDEYERYRMDFKLRNLWWLWYHRRIETGTSRDSISKVFQEKISIYMDNNYPNIKELVKDEAHKTAG